MKYNNKNKIDDELALKQLQRSCKLKVISMLVHIIPEAECQEVFQEALIKIFLIAKKSPSNEAMTHKLMQLEPLLFTVSKNLALSRARHKQVRERYCQKEELVKNEQIIDSLDTAIDKEKEHALLKEAIENLPPICKKIFVERKIQGASHSEISQKYEISKKTVENHITKGLKLCREFILDKHIRHNKQSKKSA